MFFEQGFCIGKGDNPKILNFRVWQICQFYSNVWTSGKFFLQFGVVFMNFWENFRTFIFFRENSDFPC